MSLTKICVIQAAGDGPGQEVIEGQYYKENFAGVEHQNGKFHTQFPGQTAGASVSVGDFYLRETGTQQFFANVVAVVAVANVLVNETGGAFLVVVPGVGSALDRKSTRLNSSHVRI